MLKQVHLNEPSYEVACTVWYAIQLTRVGHQQFSLFVYQAKLELVNLVDNEVLILTFLDVLMQHFLVRGCHKNDLHFDLEEFSNGIAPAQLDIDEAALRRKHFQ